MESSITWKALPFAVATCILSGALIALADPPHTPPPEAFSACTSKQRGDKCAVQVGGREIGGICSSGPEEKLFCRPDHMPTRGPPPEALAACTSAVAPAGAVWAPALRRDEGGAQGILGATLRARCGPAAMHPRACTEEIARE